MPNETPKNCTTSVFKVQFRNILFKKHTIYDVIPLINNLPLNLKYPLAQAQHSTKKYNSVLPFQRVFYTMEEFYDEQLKRF